jgi:hypothetical protein
MVLPFIGQRRWIPRNVWDRLPEGALTAGDREPEEMERLEADVRIFTVTPREHPFGQMARAAKIISAKANNRNGLSFIKNTRSCQAKNNPNYKYLIYRSFSQLVGFLRNRG